MGGTGWSLAAGRWRPARGILARSVLCWMSQARLVPPSPFPPHPRSLHHPICHRAAWLLSPDEISSCLCPCSPRGGRRPQMSPTPACLMLTPSDPVNLHPIVNFCYWAPGSDSSFWQAGVWLVQNIPQGHVNAGLECQRAVIWLASFQFVSCRPEERSQNYVDSQMVFHSNFQGMQFLLTLLANDYP